MKRTILYIGLVATIIILAGVTYYHYFYRRQTTGIVNYIKERDKETILDLFKKNWYWLVSEYSKDFSPELMLEHRAHDKSPQSYGSVTIKVILENGVPVGFVSYYMKKFYEGFIWFLAVTEEARNKKYGGELLQTALDDLKKRGAKYVRLITRTNNYPAQALYKKLGFREMRRDEKFIDYEKIIDS